MGEVLSIERFYSEGRSQKLLGLRCNKGHVTAPPRHSCRVCNSVNLSVIELSGGGKMLSYTEVYSKSKEFPLETPYILALVNLDEGPNLLGVLKEGVRALTPGQRVLVRFEKLHNVAKESDEWPRITFVPE